MVGIVLKVDVSSNCICRVTNFMLPESGFIYCLATYCLVKRNLLVWSIIWRKLGRDKDLTGNYILHICYLYIEDFFQFFSVIKPSISSSLTPLSQITFYFLSLHKGVRQLVLALNWILKLSGSKHFDCQQ